MMHCIYHRDNDGRCSAAIVNKKYKKDINFIDINYGETPPWEDIKSDDTVYIVDFSLTNEQWEILLAVTEDVIWIDHHKSAINQTGVQNKLKGVRTEGVAAANITWNYLFGDLEMPWIVKYISDFDIWAFEFAETKYVNDGAYIRDLHPNSSFWSKMLNFDTPSQIEIANQELDKIISDGQAIVEFTNKRSEHIMNHQSYYTTFEGYKTIVCNNRGVSSMFDSIDPKTYDLKCWWWMDGKEWQYRISSNRDDIDCSKICKKYGGGGHKGVGGFHLPKMVPELVFIGKK